MTNLFKEVKEAKSVLIAGGGLAGVELAAEIATIYKPEDKKVGLCTSGTRLLPSMPMEAH